jgi:hypothetical protein
VRGVSGEPAKTIDIPVDDGGAGRVTVYGAAIGSTVNNGGFEYLSGYLYAYVYSLGSAVASDTMVDSGGTQVMSAYGTVIRNQDHGDQRRL